MATRKKKAVAHTAYTIHLKLGTKTFSSSHADPTKAILALSPAKLNSPAFFTLEFQGKSATLMRRVPLTRRILSSYDYAYFMARNLISLLK